LAVEASRQRRPLAVSMTIDVERRQAMGRDWRFDGLAFHPDSIDGGLDGARAVALSRVIPSKVLEREPLDTPDRAPRFIARVLGCPSLVARAAAGEPPAVSLDSMCNFR
jgi:hypothetical protein